MNSRILVIDGLTFIYDFFCQTIGIDFLHIVYTLDNINIFLEDCQHAVLPYNEMILKPQLYLF